MADEFDAIAATLIAQHSAEAAASEAAENATAEEPVSDTPVVETKAEPETPPVVEPPKVEEIRDWKAIAAADKERRAQKAQARETQTKIEAENTALKARIAKLDAFEKRKAEDPLAALEDVGLSYDDLTTRYIASLEKKRAGGEPLAAKLPPEVEELTRSVREIEAKLKADREELDAREYQAHVRVIAEQIEGVAKAEEFELVRTHPEGKSRAFAIMVAYYNETGGKHLPALEAVKEAEAALEREFLEPVLQTKKAQRKFAAIAPSPKKEEPAPTLTQGLKQPSSSGGNKDDLAEMLSIFNRLHAQEAQD